jgi:hypothetical protein
VAALSRGQAVRPMAPYACGLRDPLRANGRCEGWELSGNHQRSRQLCTALFRSFVHGRDLRNYDSDLVAGIGMHG